MGFWRLPSLSVPNRTDEPGRRAAGAWCSFGGERAFLVAAVLAITAVLAGCLAGAGYLIPLIR